MRAALFQCYLCMIWDIRVFYLPFQHLPSVKGFFSTCYKYQCILLLWGYHICHKDHFHVALDLLRSLYLVS